MYLTYNSVEFVHALDKFLVPSYEIQNASITSHQYGKGRNMKLGEIRVKDFLEKVHGEVYGRQLSDAKNRYYEATYEWEVQQGELLKVKRQGSQSYAQIPAVIELDASLVSFFGLYSGDGAKGSEGSNDRGLIRPTISFSQHEPNLIRFAVEQFRRIFPQAWFTFSYGEDSAYFMAGEGLKALIDSYGGTLPQLPVLQKVRPQLSGADRRYLNEKRQAQENVEQDLAFYYFHKSRMEEILKEQKRKHIEASGIVISPRDRITASLRRPYKKGARQPGGSSRSDETSVGNVSGMGELFLKILHEIEASIRDDARISTQGLVIWNDQPSLLGEVVDAQQFFSTHSYGQLAGERPTFTQSLLTTDGAYIVGQWPRSAPVPLKRQVRLSPLWCFAAGLYLAEGTTTKKQLFSMYRHQPSGLALGFTSSENTSLEFILRSLQQLFPRDRCVHTWKVKVGSQYFPELVVIGLKNGVPMLRGGRSGDGKLRTMEISLSILDWALKLGPAMVPYQDKYTHVEPTGAGVPRIDFSASSALCKWYFPLIMYATFGSTVHNPSEEFIHG